jgi:queuosine precursor transporter
LQLAVILPPSPGFKNNDAYVLVLSQVPRIVIGAWVALFGGQFINDYVLARMKVMTRGKYLWMRTIGSTLTGQAVDTTLFYTIALYNIIPAGLLVNSILSAWILKVIIEIVMTPFTYFVVKKLKKLENEDYYDKKTNFNPFVFQSR